MAILSRKQVESANVIEQPGGWLLDIDGDSLVETCLYHMVGNRWREETCGTCGELDTVDWPDDAGRCDDEGKMVMRAAPACGCWQVKKEQGDATRDSKSKSLADSPR